MKKIFKYSLGIAAMAFMGIMSSCSEYKPTDMPDVPDLPKVVDLKASVDNRVVTISWSYPSTSLEIEGVNIIVNNNNGSVIPLDKGTTSYTVKGQPMEDEYMYTVKVRYKGGDSNYISEGSTVFATVPYEQLADVTSLQVTDKEKRNVSFAWTLPAATGITGVRVALDGEEGGTVFEGANVTSGTVGGLKTGVDLKFRVQVQYDGAYYSDGVVINDALPKMETRTAFLLLADSPAALEDDDEKAAAAWYNDNYVATDKGDFITVPQLSEIDFDEYGVIWIMVDRVGLEPGWQNLPAGLASSSTIDLLKAYSANGGSLYLSNMATQLTVPLGIVPENMPINAFNSNEGGENGDIWTINPFLGWAFKGTDNYYDRSAHAVFEGITLENLNGYEYASLPLIGPGFKEDHNSLWDINPYWHDAGDPAPNCVKWFENVTNSLVLAVWGQVADHCIAGMVDFNATATHGRCIAMGLAAYEWNQNSNANIYQQNIEKLTSNILNILN